MVERLIDVVEFGRAEVLSRFTKELGIRIDARMGALATSAQQWLFAMGERVPLYQARPERGGGESHIEAPVYVCHRTSLDEAFRFCHS